MTLRRVLTQALSFAAIAAAILTVPLLWRPVLHAFRPVSNEQPSYLPALESSRARHPFVDDVANDLAQYPPDLIIIGDSMAGRIDSDRLRELSGQSVAPILMNATGPAYWYLVFKNQVIASGTHPKWVFIFFRDTNLTDVMFRLDGPNRAGLDTVAHEREDELNRVVASRTYRPWQGVHEVLDQVYETRRLQEWLPSVMNAWPASVVAPGNPARLLELANRAFTLDRLRPMAQADIEAADARDADFLANVDKSVLPLMISLAREHQVRLGFVRVIRRPVNQAPPPESRELQQYVALLRQYIEEQGAVLLDDRDDPELARIEYGDGDHISRDARGVYTERFWARVSRLTP